MKDQENTKVNSPLLQMTGINKAFSGVSALKDVHFDLHAGEVHALMGENGAGKSTLMKILTGVYHRDAGIVRIDNKEVLYKNTGEAIDDGVIIVHQELNMMDDLTVAENMFLGRETMKGFLIKDSDDERRAQKIFDQLKVDIDPKAKVNDITVGQQQMVEIAKAVSMDAKIIIFDEPTSALTKKEIDELFVIINHLREKNVGIVYITHRMDEVFEISDRITVLRDGGYVGTVNTSETSKHQLIGMMVGRELTEHVKEKSMVPKDAPVVLKVENLKAGRMVKNVSFELRKGEILGFSGLMGAGRTEMARLIYGADPLDSGKIYLHGKEVTINNTKKAVELGIGYLSEDRRRYGVITDMDIANNTVMAKLENYISCGIINDKKIAKEALELNEKLNTKMTGVHQIVRTLSGGNQQKVVIAKWLVCDSEILIFDEPTRGIDVGAKADIYELMQKLADSGKSIIMISSELQEILRMSDRVAVMCEGYLTGILDIEEITQQDIIYHATLRNEE